MITAIKKNILNILNPIGLGAFIQLASKSYLKEIGWFLSVRNKSSINKNKQAIPWVTYPFTHFIEERLTKEFIIFEFGAGASTLWFSDKVHKVYSVENNLSWKESIQNKNIPNVTIEYADKDTDAYTQHILNYNFNFDLVLVDGRNRVKCIKESISKLSTGGVLVLDNSEREIYNEGIIFLKENGFKRLDFWGMAPSIAQISCTSIFYKENNCIGL